jgi:hypothetical protein
MEVYVRPFLPVALSLGLLVISCNGSDPGGGVSTAGTEAPAAAADSQLSVVDTIGVELGDSVRMFGTIGTVCYTTRGDIAVGDVGQMRLRLFSPAGEHLASGGRRGEGPGEFAAPGGLYPVPGGGVAVPDRMGGKIIYYDSTLSLDHEWKGFEGRPPAEMVQLPDGAIVGTEIDFDRSSGRLINRLCRWEAGGSSPSLTYLERSADFNRQNPRQAWHETAIYFAAFEDGRVVSTPESREECVITCWSAEGEMEWRVDRPFERTPRPEEDIAWEREMIRRRITRRGGDASFADRMEIPQWSEAVIDMQVVEGRIWVRRGGSAVPFYEVLDSEGNLLFTCSVPELPHGSGVEVYVSSHGVLAYESNPPDYYKVYLLR